MATDFELAVVEVKTYVPGVEDSVDSPVHDVVVRGSDLSEFIGAIKGYVAQCKGEVSEINIEAGFIKIDMENVTLDCEFAFEGELSKEDVKKLSKLEKGS